MNPVIEVRHLYKSYERAPVLRGLDLLVAPGEIYGLIGSNGSGKTTLLHVLLGFLHPDRGTRLLFGEADVDEVRYRIGYVPERQQYIQRITPREYLRLLGQLNDLSGARLQARVEAELEAFGLTEVADRLLSSFSKGMLQRVGLAQAMINEPDLLLLDEPLSGLDPASQRDLLEQLMQLRQRGVTTLFTSHDLVEMELVCDRIGVLHQGQIVVDVDAARLRGPARTVHLQLAELPESFVTRITRLDPAISCEGTTIIIRPNTAELQARVLRDVLEAKLPIVALLPQARPIDELFRRIVRGESLDGVLGAPPTPPAGMFAPPGHPDALHAPTRPAGDTLLNALLHADERRETREIPLDQLTLEEQAVPPEPSTESQTERS